MRLKYHLIFVGTGCNNSNAFLTHKATFPIFVFMNDFCQQMGAVVVDAQTLIKEFPPQYISENKKWCFERALAQKASVLSQESQIKISRWCKDDDFDDSLLFDLELPNVITNDRYFKYDNYESDFFMNFADRLLFGFYDADNFAQDEIQTLEMPLLASCMHYLDEKNLPSLKPVTKENKKPTPYIFENVPYWLRINLSYNGQNLYGRNFRNASKGLLEKAVQVVQEEKLVNILAARAPACGSGQYTKAQLTEFLESAYCAFRGAVLCNAAGSDDNESKPVKIHTGNWGCGAFGNKLTVSYLVQLLAGAFSKTGTLIFHAPDKPTLQKAIDLISTLPSKLTFSQAVDFLFDQGLYWNESDGE